MSLFKSIISSVAIFAVVSMFPSSVLAAGTASFSLSPSRASVAQNETFSVGIYENGTNVNAVTAKLTFDASKVQFLGIDASSSAFPNGIAETNGVTRYSNGGTVVNGSAYVAAAQFKVVAATGTATVSITAGSKIASGGVDTWNGAASATSVQLTAPAPAAATATPGRGAGPTTVAPATTHTTAPTTASNTNTSNSGAAASTTSTPSNTPAARTASAAKSASITAATVNTKDAAKTSSTIIQWVVSLTLLAAVAATIYFLRKRVMADDAVVVAPVVVKPVSRSAVVATAATTTKVSRKTSSKKLVAKNK